MRKLVCCFSLLVVFSLGLNGESEDVDTKELRKFAQSLRASESLRLLRPAGAVSVLGRDLDAIFNFVRDEIAFEPYEGALRGGSGALLAGAGNSFDQALLLKEMLDGIEIRSRIARGELPREYAEKLVGSIRPAVEKESVFGEADLKKMGVSAERFSNGWQQYASAVDKLIEKTVSAALDDLEALELPEHTLGADLVEISRDYYWVQLLSGDTSFDLHPAFAKGEAPRIEPSALVNDIASIPSHLFHWVNLRVFAERIDGADLVRFKLLEKKILPAAVAGKTVTLSLRPSRDGQEVILQPSVKAGELILSGDRISISAGDASPKNGALTALWLEVGILSPAKRPRIATITLADTLAPRQPVAEGDKAPKPDRSLTFQELSLSVELAVLGGRVDRRAMLAHGARQADWYSGFFSASEKGGGSGLSLAGFPGENPILLHWSATVAGAWAEAMPGMRLYADAPAVACAVYLPTKFGEHFELKTAIGILHLKTCSANRSQEDRTLAALIASRLLAGIAELHAGGAGEAVSALPSAKVEKYQAVTSEDVKRDGIAGWDRQTLLELEDDLLRRQTVLVPSVEGEAPGFWWRVEQGSADPVARGPAGWPVWLRGGECAPAEGGFIQGELLRASCGHGGDVAYAVAVFAQRHLLAAGASPFVPLMRAFSEKLAAQFEAALGKSSQ